MKKESLKEQIIKEFGIDFWNKQNELTETITTKDCHDILNEIVKTNKSK